MRRFRFYGRVLMAIIGLSFLPSFSLALERGEVILSGGPVMTQIMAGGISANGDSVDYSDIFKTGWGIGLDGMLALSRWIRIGGGFSTTIFPGDKLGGEDVSKWWVAPMMAGVELFPINVFTDSKLAPYLRADFGVVFLGGVHVDNPAGDTDLKLFRTTAAYAGDIGAGLEWQFGKQWGCFGEVRYMMTGHPYGGGDISAHDQDPVSSLPVRLGITYVY